MISSAIKLVNRCHDIQNCLDGCRLFCKSLYIHPDGGRHQNFALRSLFKAVVMIICGKDYQTCQQVRKLEEIPVLLVLTGRGRHLTAPISLARFSDQTVVDGKVVAKTLLSDAVNFMLMLEAREKGRLDPYKNGANMIMTITATVTVKATLRN